MEAIDEERVPKMKSWFAAALLYERVHPEPVSESTPLWEESIVLISAATEGAAKEEALRIGRKEEVEFKAMSGELVSWRFKGVIEVQAIVAPIENAVEVFSRFLNTPPVIDGQ